MNLHRCAFVALAVATAAVAQEQPYKGLGAESVTPEIVAKYAPPPLDVRFTRNIQALLDVRAPGLGIVAPGGKQLFFGWGITGSQQVFRLDQPKGFPIQMTGGEERTTLSAVTPDGTWVVLSRDVGGQENPGIYLQAPRGGPLVRVYHAPKVQAYVDFVSDDGRELYFHANDVTPDSYAIYKYDIASGNRTLVWGEKGRWAVADHMGRGGALKLLLVNAKTSFGREYVEFVPATRKVTPLLGAGEDVLYDAEYAAQPGELLVVTNKFRDFRTLYRWKMGSDSTPASFREVLAPEGRDVERFSLDHPRRHVYVQVNEGGYTRLTVLDAKTYARIALPLPANAEHAYAGMSTLDGRFVTIGGRDRAGAAHELRMGLGAQGADAVARARGSGGRSRGVRAGKAHDVPRARRHADPDVRPLSEGLCTRRESDSRSMPGDRDVPWRAGGRRRARASRRITRSSSTRATSWSEPNVRGSDGYGKAWLDADDGPKRLDVITDIEDAGRYRAHAMGAQRQGAARRRHRRQLRRLLDAGRDDDVRRHLRRRRVERRHQQSRDPSCTTLRRTGAACARPNTAIRTRMRKRCASFRPSTISTGCRGRCS